MLNLKNIPNLLKKICKIKVSVFIYSLILSIAITLCLNRISLCYVKEKWYIVLFFWNVSLFLWFILFSFNKWVLKIVSFITCFFLCIYNGYIYMVRSLNGNINFRFNELTLAFIIDTNPTEAREFLGGDIGHALSLFLFKYCSVPLLIIILLRIKSEKYILRDLWRRLYVELRELIVLLVKWFYKFREISSIIILYLKKFSGVINKFIITLCIIFICSCMFMKKINGDNPSLQKINEEDPLMQIIKITQKFVSNRYSFLSTKTHDYSATLKEKDNDLIVVFYFGESARGDRFSLNGYERETNPLLSKRKNLISFKNAHSCRTSTRLSFNCVMQGHNDRENYAYEQKGQTLYSFFKQVGFKTAFLSTGANDLSDFLVKDLDGIYIDMSKETFLNQYRQTFDYKLVDMLGNFLSKTSGPKFVTMIGRGSHYDYGSRVPKEFYKFKTTDEKLSNEVINKSGANCYLINGKKRGDINDSYDATILYTDYVIDSIIGELADKDAIFIYASDHGESFGEDDTEGCTHAYYSNDEQIWNIPFIFWVSDKFIEKHPEKYANIKLFEKQAENEERMVSHDNIIHTLLDCSSIESEILDKRFSMCSQTDVIYENKFEGLDRFDKSDEKAFTKDVPTMKFNKRLPSNLSVSGLSETKEWGRWSDGASVKFEITDLPQKDLIVKFRTKAFLCEKRRFQKADVYINGKLVTQWKYKFEGPKPNTILKVSEKEIKNGNLKIELKIHNPVSPRELRIGRSFKKASIGFIELTIKEDKKSNKVKKRRGLRNSAI